jgi:hypothetical protein
MVAVGTPCELVWGSYWKSVLMPRFFHLSKELMGWAKTPIGKKSWLGSWASALGVRAPSPMTADASAIAARRRSGCFVVWVDSKVRLDEETAFVGLPGNFTTFRQARADRLVREAQQYISRPPLQVCPPFALEHLPCWRCEDRLDIKWLH